MRGPVLVSGVAPICGRVLCEACVGLEEGHSPSVVWVEREGS